MEHATPGKGGVLHRRYGKVSASRRLALEVLSDVRAGVYAEEGLATRLSSESALSPADRALATELVYGVLRWQTHLDGIMARCSRDPVVRIHPVIRDILRLALYQLFFLDRIPDHAAVHDAVNQAGRIVGAKTAGFVNALLRRAVREKGRVDPPPDDGIDALARYYAHPRWLVDRWVTELGLETARNVLSFHNTRAPLTLRANSLKTTRDALAETLRSQGFSVELSDYAPDGLRVAYARVSPDALPGYADGLFAVQDVASQMIAPLLGCSASTRILDVCAAPGGKTAHLAALTGNGAHVTALEMDPVRAAATEEHLRRLGVTCAQVICGDAADARFLASLGTFDSILVDPPCSGLGVLRHNPETRFRVVERDLGRYASTQRDILEAASTALKPGGILLYCVCTPMREETVEVVETFLSRHPEVEVVPILRDEVPAPLFVTPAGFFATFPPMGNEPIDGFFAARLCKLS